MTVKPTITSPPDPDFLKMTAAEADITFEDITFEYVKGKKILESFSLHVPGGKRVAIVGGSGSGKSTLIRMLFRFLEPQSGRIRINGKDIK